MSDDQILQDFLRRAGHSQATLPTFHGHGGLHGFHTNEGGYDPREEGTHTASVNRGMEEDYQNGPGRDYLDVPGSSSRGNRNVSTTSRASSSMAMSMSGRCGRRRAEEAGRIPSHGSPNPYKHYPHPDLDPDLDDLDRSEESSTESLEDQGNYDPSPLTPAPDHLQIPYNSGRPTRSTFQPISDPSLTSTTTTRTNPTNSTISTISTTTKRRGRPPLPPEERDSRRRERARQSAAESRRKKRDVEGEREWMKGVEIEKAVLEEKYRTLVRDYADLKTQVSRIPCLALLDHSLAILVNAPPCHRLTDGPMLQVVLPVLLRTIASGENGIDVNALLGLIQARSAGPSRTNGGERVVLGLNGMGETSSRNTGKRKSSEKSEKRRSDKDMGRQGEVEEDGSTSTDSAQSTPRIDRRRVKRVRMELGRRDEDDEPNRGSGRDQPDELGDTGGIDGGMDDSMNMPDTPGNAPATPDRSPSEGRPSILMSLRKRTQSGSVPEPIPATPIDSDEDDGDFVPESELDENGPTPRTEQGPESSPGTYDETPRTGVEGEEEDDDDERFVYDPDDPDFSQPIVDVAVPAWFGAGWAGVGLDGTPGVSSEAAKGPVIGHEERDDLVARLRAEMDKTPGEA